MPLASSLSPRPLPPRSFSIALLALMAGCSGPYYNEPYFPSVVQDWRLTRMAPDAAVEQLRLKGFTCSDLTRTQDVVECTRQFDEANCAREFVWLSVNPARTSIESTQGAARKGC